MSRLNHQHAAYALRRENEYNKVQAVQEVNRYYDHWGKVTSRFENWTNKEYYNNADKKLQTKREQTEKEQNLNARRQKLRQLLEKEKDGYDFEMGRKKSRRGDSPRDTETLNRLNQALIEKEKIKSKLEMEAKLYGRWRHGVDDEKLLYDTKSDNQVMAKLNWLDKQIENQQLKEQEEALAAERQLQLQQEINRAEQTQKERQLIREQEIKEIRALQETHMNELKERAAESEKLKEEEKHLRLFIEELKKEQQLIEESTAMVLQRPDIAQAFNLKKIKLFIRNRSATFVKQIDLCVNLLQRIKHYAFKPEAVQALLTKYKEQKEAETLASAQIDSMYESEAKYNLQRCEDTWKEEHLKRYSEIKQLIEDETNGLTNMLQESLAQQQELIELRSTHLAAIETSNKKLEQLCQEAEASPRGLQLQPAGLSSSSSTSLVVPKATSSCIQLEKSSHDMPKVTDSFSNLNLDCWANLPSVRGGIDSPRLNKTRSMNVVEASTSVPPKFARKRVAWT